ncbi:TonB-dependent receptor [Candidatus Palauibacter sp.]|uniref:TonB-dependent receptor n=1 Tax=Candidatus Palauibacter sp. TaxID=3101350 RepID=UPI003D148BE1
MRFGNLSTTAMMMAGILTSVGCDRGESPFAPDFGVEEPPRPSVSAEPPSAAELPAETTDVQPKSTPRISRVSIRPLIIIDGVMQPEDSELAGLEALDIYHVEIVKGRAAAILFGPRAANGAIDIQTRHRTQATILNGLKPR